MQTRIQQGDEQVDSEQSRHDLASYRQRNDQLENYFTYVADPIFVAEADGRIIDANPAACELLGYSRDELLTMCPWDFVTSASRDEILNLVGTLQQGIPASVQRTYRRQSGEQLDIDLRLTRFENAGRDLVIVACRDITETRRLEQQLRESRQNLAEGQRLTKTGSWILDPKTGETDWSVETCRIFGFPDPPPSPHYKEFRARVHPDDREAVDNLLIESSLTGEPMPLRYLFVLPDGTMKNIETVSQPVRDDGGQVVSLMGTVMDVTERHHAEEALRASEKLARGQMQALIRTLDAMAQESAPDKFLEHVLATILQQLDAYNISVMQKDSANCLTGLEYSRENARLQSPSDSPVPLFLSPEDSPPWEAVCRTGKCVVCEDVAEATYLPYREHLMALGIVTVLLVPMLIAGEVAGLIGVRFNRKRTFRAEELELAQALTHQATLAIQLTRLAEQSRQAAIEAERNRFARDMHDTLAQGFTGVIIQLEAALDAASKGLTQASEEHIHRAGEMARYGLSEARRSVKSLRPQALEENDLCVALSDLLEKMTSGTSLGAELTLQGEPRPLPGGWDEHLLRIGQEALINTFRHALATHFSARIVFSESEVCLELSDNGCGFEPGDKRSGFGLLGMKERVAEMKGELTVDSAPGKGTVISVVLSLPDTAGRP